MKTLVLDLDETLVHSSLEASFPHEKELHITINGRSGTIYSNRRPGLDEFLQVVSRLYEVVVFTAGEPDYGEAVLDWIDPSKSLIRYRLYRSSCVTAENVQVKDLRILRRDLSQVIIVDNSLYAFGLQIDNGILIRSWRGDATDRELGALTKVLETLVQVEDVRVWLKRSLGLRQLVFGN